MDMSFPEKLGKRSDPFRRKLPGPRHEQNTLNLMTSIKALHDFTTHAVQILRGQFPKVNIVRNDSPDQRTIPMICITPDSCIPEGFDDDTWSMTLNIESVQQIDAPQGEAASRLDDMIMAIGEMQEAGSYLLSEVIEKGSNIVIVEDAITCSVNLDFHITLN